MPVLFGEQVGGSLFLVTPREHWYDESDVEIGHAIAAALRRANGNKSRAAAALGFSRTRLLRRLRRFGLTV